jgi:hypothetical protein
MDPAGLQSPRQSRPHPGRKGHPGAKEKLMERNRYQDNGLVRPGKDILNIKVASKNINRALRYDPLAKGEDPYLTEQDILQLN